MYFVITIHLQFMDTSCFHFLSTVDNAVVNAGVQMSLKCADLRVTADIPRNEFSGYLVNLLGIWNSRRREWMIEIICVFLVFILRLEDENK